MVIIRTRQELIDHVADITGRRDIITEAMEALDNWQSLTPTEQAATEKMLNLPTTTEPEPEPEAPAMTVNQKVHALGKLKNTSSEAKFTKALEKLVADWQAESLAQNGGNPKYADFKDTKVWSKADSVGREWGGSLALTFDGSGYDLLSCQNEYHIESYRNALTALCDRHGWAYDDYSTWSITFFKN